MTRPSALCTLLCPHAHTHVFPLRSAGEQDVKACLSAWPRLSRLPRVVPVARHHVARLPQPQVVHLGVHGAAGTSGVGLLTCGGREGPRVGHEPVSFGDLLASLPLHGWGD